MHLASRLNSDLSEERKAHDSTLARSEIRPRTGNEERKKNDIRILRIDDVFLFFCKPAAVIQPDKFTFMNRVLMTNVYKTIKQIVTFCDRAHYTAKLFSRLSILLQVIIRDNPIETRIITTCKKIILLSE